MCYSKSVEEQKEVAEDNKRLEVQIENGKKRSMNYSNEWQEVDINEIIGRFTPGAKPEKINGKIVFTSLDGTRAIIADVGGGYLRIQDLTSNSKKPRYLDINGNDAYNVNENGRIRGRTRAEYNKATHFKIKKRRKYYD